MSFGSKETCIIKGFDEYVVSICFNGEFYQARVINPPNRFWTEVGIGATEQEAVNALLLKLEQMYFAA